MIVARAHPLQPEEGDWPARVLAVAERGARGVARTCLIGAVELRPGGEAIDLDGASAPARWSCSCRAPTASWRGG